MVSRQHDDAGAYVPTPEQIAAACEEIRAGWSEDEHRKRWVRTCVSRTPGGDPIYGTRWEPPEVIEPPERRSPGDE